jgi:2-iminobutanoate/2-iminopropanoate deaminase
MDGIERVETGSAPAAIGPYSQGMKVGGLIFTAGQIPLDPATMQMVGETIAEQTDRVMRNLQAILETAGASLASVVKTTVYLADMGEFAAMNEVYARWFGEHKPARSTVQVGRLPKDAKVEIDAVARIG